MYRIVKDGAALALIEPHLCTAGRKRVFCAVPGGPGDGDCLRRDVYHLLGREAVEGAESVILGGNGR